jgi:hypothetical protein
MKKRLAILLILLSATAKAQIGGGHNFSFLNISPNAFVSSTGGINVANSGGQTGAFLQNPALPDSASAKKLAISYIPYFASTHFSSLAYAVAMPQKSLLLLGVQSVNYGSFQQTDEAGNVLGTFVANDFALNVGYNRTQGAIRMGLNLKLVGSFVEGYSAMATMIDIGGVFQHPQKDLSVGFVIKNVGFRIKSYTPNPSDLPLDVQAGVSFKPKYMPVRFTLTAHHLHQWNIVYFDPSIKRRDLSGQLIDTSPTFVDQLGRHLSGGITLLFSKNLQLGIGYNHLVRSELAEQRVAGLSGFSLGLMLHTKRIDFSFGQSGYHSAAGLSQLGLQLKL